MGDTLAVSVLDLVGMRAGESAGSAIARSVNVAQHVEQLEYTRYWLAEHHSISGLACSATPVLIGHVAAATKKIRVGSGGVMLPNHASGAGKQCSDYVTGVERLQRAAGINAGLAVCVRSAFCSGLSV